MLPSLGSFNNVGDNVVSLYGILDEVAGPNPLNEFMQDFIHWADNQDIDTSTMKFKHGAAAIMTTIQAMMVEE